MYGPQTVLGSRMGHGAVPYSSAERNLPVTRPLRVLPYFDSIRVKLPLAD
jgi:hypothetical protein